MKEHEDVALSGGEGAEDALNGAIAAVITEPSPADTRARVLAVAGAWADEPIAPAVPTHHRVPLRRWILAAVAASILLTGGFLSWLSWEFPVRTKQSSLGPNSTPLPGSVAELQVAGPERRDRQIPLYVPRPISQPVVAGDAAVLVAIGPEEPIRLGSQVSHRKILKRPEDHGERFHVWDWSDSPVSRIVKAKTAYRSAAGFLSAAAVSPDGRLLLLPNGEMVDLSAGGTRRHAGFTTDENERIDRLQFSPNGTRVAAMIIHTADDRSVRGWSIRIVGLEEGITLATFPAASVDQFAWVAFSPDGRSLFHASPDKLILCRDSRTGQLLKEYRPAIEPHGAVGIAVSPDGRQVAASHYHGELYVWDVASAELLLHHRFLKPSGQFDRFWQAKVIEFSPDGLLVATSSSGRLQIVETATGNVVARRDQPLPSYVASLRWSPDARTIILVSGPVLTGLASQGELPARGDADIFPVVYRWDWKTGNFSPLFGPESSSDGQRHQ